MPGFVRKVVIFAAVDGLILQAHGSAEHSKSLHIDYTTKKITRYAKDPVLASKQTPHLESHGVVGILSVAAFSYLISINRREQVAQILGKPVYTITDVTLLPLLSQFEATKAITAALTSKTRASVQAPSSGSEDSSESDSDTKDESPTPVDPIDSSSPTDNERSSTERNVGGTSIARDVIAKKGQYGRFASQWFSRKGWGLGKEADEGLSTTVPEPATAVIPSSLHDSDSGGRLTEALTTSEGLTQTTENRSREDLDAAKSCPPPGATETLLPKIVRSTKMILSSRSFFFSYDINLTRRLSDSNFSGLTDIRLEALDPLYFWNRRLGTPLHQAGHDAFLMPIIQGFVGQRSFSVEQTVKGRSDSVIAQSVSTDETENMPEETSTPKPVKTSTSGSRAFLLTVISRRSTKRSGLRYLRRGIDDEGNCANAVETEQILSSPDWDDSRKTYAFLQMRASIPLYFSQTPYAFKPVPTLHHSAATNEQAFRRHFGDLQRRYGDIQVALLVDRHGNELSIGEAYERAVQDLNRDGAMKPLTFEWFDFHAECRGMKFENVDILVKKLGNTLTSFGQTILEKGTISRKQTGIIRTNCMDCLDRTNVAESAFAQYMLQQDLQHEGFDIDLLHDDSTQWFNTLWADNGDAISRQYASTAALKGDFTRTRKRNYRGALNDLGLTLSRYYNNMVNDYFAQAVIDVLLGNVSARIFEDFESTMMSADPGISIEKVRLNAIETCSKIVIQDSGEDLIHGWTLLSPAEPNTIRTLPFEETVVLLTESALYCCRFDWNTEKVASFEKVDLHSISKIRVGTYVTSVLTDRQMKEDWNVGLTILYSPGKKSTIRVNTRSLQSAVNPEDTSTIDGGTGIMSWLGPKVPETSRIMALKVIPRGSDNVARPAEMPMASAEQICEEIRRAATLVESTDLVEKGDIISLAEAKKRTGYLETLSHSIKKLVWT